MANNLPPISAFEVGTNPSESWRHRKEDFEDYLKALRYSEVPEKTKTALFCHLCREELKKQLQAFDLKPNDGSYGTKCRNCDGRNHWAKMCRTQRNKQKIMADRKVNAIEENSEHSENIYIVELKSVNELDREKTNCVV
ncbi:reverse transcriptase domain-containing protein [Trichonephila clavipes]|nr:reverse transcriptase domain-containing protein [Trichonephila clavipes]